jgi:hypothetical protein
MAPAGDGGGFVLSIAPRRTFFPLACPPLLLLALLGPALSCAVLRGGFDATPLLCSLLALVAAVPGRGMGRSKTFRAALEEAESTSSRRRGFPLTPTPRRRCSLWVHGRACSRRVKSRERAATLSRGDLAAAIPRLPGSAGRPPPSLVTIRGPVDPVSQREEPPPTMS